MPSEVIRKGSKCQKVLLEDISKVKHLESDTGLFLSAPCFKINKKLLGKRFRPPYTEISFDSSRLTMRKLARSDDVLLGSFSIADANNSSGKRKRLAVKNDCWTIETVCKRLKILVSLFDMRLKCPLEMFGKENGFFKGETMRKVTLNSVKVAREAAHEKLPQSP